MVSHPASSGIVNLVQVISFRFQVLGLGVESWGLRDEGSGLRIKGLEVRGQGLGVRVESCVYGEVQRDVQGVA